MIIETVVMEHNFLSPTAENELSAEDIISVWNKTASDQATTARIRDTLRRVLNLPPSTIMEYKTHTDSIKDNSSFRNTKIAV
ncbi:hypothetical protein scyTo_0008103 [Scyliorhinus torazame]|uniref:Uncharacterized protein n=1 Tax=Scyliorhinus torazame TaxID=75743 RepID=A0A401P3K6_SCYTO|nr:hypothetical protein [Scyliorhinus torazame]